MTITNNGDGNVDFDDATDEKNVNIRDGERVTWLTHHHYKQLLGLIFTPLYSSSLF